MSTEQFPAGSYALVGRNPNEIVYVRAEDPDAGTLWYGLVGTPGHVHRWATLTGPDPTTGATPPVVRLYTDVQAVADLLLPLLSEQYRMTWAQAQAATTGSASRQLSQQALGLRQFAEWMAGQVGLPGPEWGDPPPPAPVAALREPTQPIAVFPPPATEPVAAVPVEPATPAPAGPSAPAAGGRSGWLRRWWPTNSASQSRGRHRHNDRDRQHDGTGQHQRVTAT